MRPQLGLPARAQRGRDLAAAERPSPDPLGAGARRQPSVAHGLLLRGRRLRALRRRARPRSARARAGGRGRRNRDPRALRPPSDGNAARPARTRRSGDCDRRSRVALVPANAKPAGR